MKKLSKAISIILCLSLLLSLGIEAFAATDTGDETSASFDSVKGETEEVGNIVKELTEERTEFTKEFLLDDGSKMLAQYAQPIHFQNDKKEWVDYDNTLDDNLKNKSSNISVDLSDKAKAEEMIALSAGGNSISWGYKDIENCVAVKINNEKKSIGNSKYTELSKTSSKTIYQNVYKNVNLEYYVTSSGVKENIVLKESDVQNEFYITYNIGSLTANQVDDYAISVCNKNGDEVFSILAPYMTDAKGEISKKLKINLEKLENGKLEVKLSADKGFIQSSGRSFPVIIDPEISLTTISSHFLFGEANHSGYLINHGPYYVDNTDLFLGKVSNLQPLDDGERVISAKYTFEVSNSDTLFTNESDSAIVINAHKLNSLSNTVLTYDPTIVDYDTLTYSDNESVTFDVTKLYRDWYADSEIPRGFVLEAHQTAGSKSVQFTQYITKPILTVVYKDFKGTESSLSYHTFDVGQNASASVSDYLGNLVINQTLYEGKGSRMPLSLSATYNSINYDETFGNGSPSGFGWQFSFNQYVRDADFALVNAGYDYIYKDSDGTDHYMKRSDNSNEWYDEDGIGLTLKVTDDNIIIENGVTQTYELTSDGGKLLSEKDEYNNTITYAYTNGNITSITDGAGRTFTFNYANNSNGESRIRYIKLPNNKSISFYYTSNVKDKFSYIYFPGGKVSKFEYNNDDRLVSVQQADQTTTPHTNGIKTAFTYNSAGQVINVTEYGSDNSVGESLEIEYGTDNTTTFTDKYDRSCTYTFDNSGYKISTLNENGYIDNDGGGLRITGGSNNFVKNYITQSINQNGNYYTKFDGHRDNTASNGGTMSFDNSAPSEENGKVQFLGNTSIKINNPVSNNNSSFYTGAYHAFSGFDEQDVTFSAYVKTKDVTQIYNDGAIGAVLTIRYQDGDDTVEVNSIGYTGTSEWQRLSVSAHINGNFDVCCSVRNASGTAWFDCLQLETGNSVNDFNALQDCDFSDTSVWDANENTGVSFHDNSLTIQGLAGAYNDAEDEAEVEETTVEETEPATQVVEEDEPQAFGSVDTRDEYGNIIKTERGQVTRRVKKTYLVNSSEEATGENSTEEPETNGEIEEISENSLGNKYVYQTVNVNRAGVSFNIVGKAQANSVPLSNETRTFGIALNIYYDGETSPETHYQEFNCYTDIPQTAEMTVYPYDSEKVISTVAFAFVYGYNGNTMTAYNAMLNIASNDSSVTESNTEPETQEATVEPTTQADEEDVDDYIDYEVISESVDTSQTFMRTSAEYTDDGNFAATSYDEANNQEDYSYDIDGNLTSYFCGTGDETEYEYDNAGNVTKIKKYDAQNLYSYNSAGYVSEIQHNNFSYTFNYDVFNRLISSKIGNTALSSNIYSNGYLTKTIFANSDFIEYGYDDYGNIIELKDESGTFARFTYNKKGIATKAEDIIDQDNTNYYYYYYDFSGNKTAEYRQTDNGVLSYKLGSDSNGNAVEQTAIGNAVKTITRGSDENGSFVSNDGVRVNTESDDFGRTTKVTTSNSNSNINLNSEYTYLNGAETNSTTNLVQSLTQKLGNNQLVKYTYNYDENNNIIQAYEVDSNNNSTVVCDYEYDFNDQFQREIDYINNNYTFYHYDNAGNITSVDKYQFDPQTNLPTTLLSQNTYEYGDNVWKDKLTKFNGTTITYDNSGNPLTYRNGMSFSWIRGRVLDKITINNSEIQMRYDSNGIRTHKGNVRYYYDSNNNLIALAKGSSTLFFYYDDSGNPTSFSDGTNMYYYVKNIQGDIVKIVSSTGAVVANYAYNVWGEMLSVKDSFGNPITDQTSIAYLNPLRYHGYVYDDETGLYYLQSRYYDPTTCRFINADVYCDTLSGSLLSANMFAYCENCPLLRYDKNGKDCWWIQAHADVHLMGHTSLLIQEKPGYWWYFYWGDKSIQLLFLGTIDSLEHISKNVNRVIAIYNKLYGWNIAYSNDYTQCIKFSGDFYNTFDKLKYLINLISYYAHVPTRLLQFDNQIDDRIFKRYKSYKAPILKSVLSGRQHTTYLNHPRPYSIVLNRNPWYDVMSENCMQRCAYGLQFGRLYNRKNQKTFNNIVINLWNAEYTYLFLNPTNGFRPSYPTQKYYFVPNYASWLIEQYHLGTYCTMFQKDIYS